MASAGSGRTLGKKRAEKRDLEEVVEEEAHNLKKDLEKEAVVLKQQNIKAGFKVSEAVDVFFPNGGIGMTLSFGLADLYFGGGETQDLVGKSQELVSMHLS